MRRAFAIIAFLSASAFAQQVVIGGQVSVSGQVQIQIPVSTLTITTTSPLPSGVQNQVYSPITLAATGGTAPYTWSVTAGSPPTGITVSSGGVVSGTPTVVQTATFTVTVTDSLSATVSRQYSLTIVSSGVACNKPIISNVTSTVLSSTSFQVTWTTDTASSSQVGYGPFYSPNVGSQATAVSDNTAGTLSHSVTVTGLIPSKTYYFGVISEGVNGSGLCGATYRNTSGGGDTNQYSVVTQAAPAGSNTYALAIVGQSHDDTKGMWLMVDPYTTQGSITGSHALTTVVTIPTLTNFAVAWYSPFGANTISTTNIANDTISWFQIDPNNAPNSVELHILTNQGGATTPGTYTLTLTTSGSGLPTVVTTKTITVDSFPFSNSAFPSNPIAGSQLAIPCLTSTSTKSDGTACVQGNGTAANWTDSMWTYGASNSRQDRDAGLDPAPYGAETSPPISGCAAGTRCIAPNDNGNLCVVSGGIQNCSWYYDGMHVYQAIATRTGNQSLWQQAINNVKAVYLPYLSNPGGGFTVFSHGIYEDWVRTADAADKTALDSAATHSATGAGSGSGVPVEYLQREVAYAFKNFYWDTKAGSSPTVPGLTNAQSIQYLLDHVLGHIDQICWSQSTTYQEYFMGGLEAEALLEYLDDGNSDSRILPAVKCLADYYWSTAWNTITSDPGAFPYDTWRNTYQIGPAQGGSSMVGLNLLLAPMYARLFKETGLSAYQVNGDSVWQHGVLFDGAAGGLCNNIAASPACNGPTAGNSGKIFSQNYYWSDKYVTWRGNGLQ